jgi:sodium pump decarboxylase gamma subunit
MIVTELMARFADPDMMQSLSIMDKLIAGLITTLLGMGITFAALIILQFIISLMDKIINKREKVPIAAASSVLTTNKSPDSKAEHCRDDTELVAVIACVIAMKLKTSVENIVIKNIERLDDRSPAWNRAGIIEQMNSRL